MGTCTKCGKAKRGRQHYSGLCADCRSQPGAAASVAAGPTVETTVEPATDDTPIGKELEDAASDSAV